MAKDCIVVLIHVKHHMIKTTPRIHVNTKFVLETNFFNLIRDVYECRSRWKAVKSFLLNLRKRHRRLFSTLHCFSHCLGYYSQCSKTKEIKV